MQFFISELIKKKNKYILRKYDFIQIEKLKEIPESLNQGSAPDPIKYKKYRKYKKDQVQKGKCFFNYLNLIVYPWVKNGSEIS
ncbi:hypothetical protein BpHYR1_044941 [Brachionus plicatilis]|uniref:Uncharacterized protein n=1 Tax=Brachionus plicatilis TaxID=10195 RepID=A0A3M7S053_BRAPC|nr:hypothetical protein BpHYR1_044941 [Brachionus plicatilis]